MKIAYFGFDLFFGCLEYLVQSKHEIVKIFTCKVDGEYEFNDKTLSLAHKQNIPLTFDKPTVNMLELLKKSGCELIISAGYYYKIPVLDGVMNVNVHPSLLPLGRGPWPLPVVLLQNHKRTGVTLHKLAQSFDSGDIILQKQFKITKEDNLSTLTAKSQSAAVLLLERFIKQPRFYYDCAVAQQNGQYWQEPSEDEMAFDITDPFEKIDRITKAFYGFHCYLKINGKTIKIKEAKCIKNAENLSCQPLISIDIAKGKLCIIKLA